MLITQVVGCMGRTSQLHRFHPTTVIFLSTVIFVLVSVCTSCSPLSPIQQSPVRQLLACKFPGTWEGEAYHSSVGNFPVTIRLGEFKKGKICGSFEAPTFGCGGSLECEGINAYGYPYTTGVYVVRNHEGYGNCYGGFYYLTRENDNMLSGALFELNQEYAEGTYHRVNSPVDPAECEPKDALIPFVVAGDDDVNIYSGPGTNFGLIDTVSAGYGPRNSRKIIGRNDDSSWWQVSTDSGPGWVAASVVTAKNIDIPVAVVEPLPGDTGSGGKPIVTAKDDNVNIRSGPGTNYDIVGTLPAGQSLEIIGRNTESSWWQVSTPDGSGWVAAWVTTASNVDESIPVVEIEPPASVATTTPSPSVLVCNTPFPEGRDGFDCQEKYLLDLLNNYRMKPENGGCGPLVHDPTLQEAAENWAKITDCSNALCHLGYPDKMIPEIMADVNSKPNDEEKKEAADEAMVFWAGSTDHNEIIKRCSLTTVGIGHTLINDRKIQCEVKGDNREGWCNKWAWVVRFGPPTSKTPAPPHPLLITDVVVDPNPVPGGQNVSFKFSIKNAGETEQAIKDIFVLAITPNGSEWKASATSKNISPGGRETFVASAATSNEGGTWQIKEISFQDNNDSWFLLNNPKGYLLNPSFTVEAVTEVPSGP